MRFVKIPAEWCPTFMFECSDIESLVMEQTRRWLPLFRAVGELCNSYFVTVCVASRCKFLFFIELKIQLHGMVFRSFWKLHFITRKLTCTPGCIPGRNEWAAYSISRYTLWPFVVSVHGKNLMRSRIVPCHVLINLFLAVRYIQWRIPNFSNWANLFSFFFFFILSFRNYKGCVYNCDDLPSNNSSPHSLHIWLSYIHNVIIIL